MIRPVQLVKLLARTEWRANWQIVFVSLLFWLAACGTSAAPTSNPTATTAAQANSPVASLSQTPASTATALALPAQTAEPTQSTPPTLVAQATALAPTPNCSNPAPLTPALTEGPYFKANSPERASLIDPGLTGTRLVLSGYVLTTVCQPIGHALLDFWQANANGQYDNTGYTLRGHQFTDASGHYQLTTVVPGLYPGRTEHIHVKVQAPNGPVLTTQLFFPGVQRNASDQIFDQKLLLPIQASGDGQAASFNFVVRLK